MKIDRVHIEHYKSLSNVDVTLHPQVTVLVGPNGSGKSNFVDALEFVRDIGRNDLVTAANKRGGLSRLYEQIVVFGKQLPETNMSCHIYGQNFEIGFESGIADATSGSYGTDELKTFGNSKKETLNWKFVNSSPNLISEFKTIKSGDLLAENLENWATVFYKNKAPFFNAIEALKVALPDLTDVKVTPVGNSHLFPEFLFEESQGGVKTFDAAQLSDGTLHFWGLLLSLYQQPSPDLIVIEEPEQYLHPGLLGLFADCVKEVSELTQIILTTHSPHLVGKFEAEQIRVVCMETGSTQISNIHHHQIEAVQEGLFSLEEFMTAEGLRPEEELS